MEAQRSLKTSGITNPKIQFHIPELLNLQQNCYKNLKPHRSRPLLHTSTTLEDLWRGGGEGTDPHILHPGTRYRWENQMSVLSGCDPGSLVNWFSEFRERVVVSSSMVIRSEKNTSLWNSSALKLDHKPLSKLRGEGRVGGWEGEGPVTQRHNTSTAPLQKT